MTILHVLQREFQEYILSGAEAFVHRATGTKKVSAETRLGIYADAYRLRLVEVLENDYPGLRSLVGDDEAFQTMMRAYVEAHPSHYFNVRWYGGKMAAFLGTALAYRERPILAEMAAFEWSMGLAFDAADQPTAGVEAASQVAPENWPAMYFLPHAALQRLDLSWNIPAIWNTADANVELETPRKTAHPTPWLIWRQEFKVYFRSLAVDEAWAIDAMKTGANFGDICEGLCEWIDEADVALHAAGMLKRWLMDGLIHRVV